MMSNDRRDNGLRKAVNNQPQYRLPSNFAYLTMKKVEESVLLRERKSERRTLIAIITVSLFLIGICIGWGYLYCKEQIYENLSHIEKGMFQIPGFCLFLIFAIPLLLCFDQWMRKQYAKRH